MKFVNRFFMILVALCLVCPGVSAVVNPKPFVIPELKEWKGAEGAFVPTETTKIVCPANQPELLRIARMLADEDQQVIDDILIVLCPQRASRFAFPVLAAVWLRRAVGAFQKGRTACQQAQRRCGCDPAFHRLYASLPV